ncbi:Putative transposase of IS4/5 family [Streptomyces sp. PAN_FS17]|nr:Putative transposase of IS4/5 family [Streptomyces sp. PAN_FS17]
MLRRLRTGAPWRDLPERCGPWQTVYERFARWEPDGTWARLLEQVQVRDDAVGVVEWTVSIDSTINRAHQHAAGARKKRGHWRRTNWKVRHIRRLARNLAGRAAG